jgi:hypothetical protein
MTTVPDVEFHDGAACDAITAELVACTLGQRRRPELRNDLAGAMARMARRIDAFKVALGLSLLPTVRQAATAFAKAFNADGAA